MSRFSMWDGFELPGLLAGSFGRLLGLGVEQAHDVLGVVEEESTAVQEAGGRREL